MKANLYFVRITILTFLLFNIYSCEEKKEKVRVGAICNDGWQSSSTGRGACSHHGGVNYWLYK